MMINKIIVGCALFISSSLFGQHPFEVVKIEAPKTGHYKYAQVEPSIAINPKNTQEMVAGTVLDDYYYSKDGGKSWTSNTLKSKYGVYGDPVLVYDTTGQVHYFHLASYNKTSHLDRIVCQSAKNAASKFNQGTFPEPNGKKVQDKQWVVLNSQTNEMYMTWTQFDAYNSKNPLDSSVIMFSKSMDEGKSWTKPLRISAFAGDCLDGDNSVEGAVPAIGKNGDIIVTWSGPKGLVVQRSSDNGETWLTKEEMITDHVGGWDIEIPGVYRANGMPVLKADQSDGPNSGTIYMNWCDQSNGVTDTDIWLAKSTDNGKHWSAPVKVNQDGSKRHQYLTWMTVDQMTGYIYIVYYDRRNTEGLATDVYLSWSKDGGQTFNDVLISNQSFTPSAKVFFGDYLNIDAVNGVIRPIWPSYVDGKIELWTALISQTELDKLNQE